MIIQPLFPEPVVIPGNVADADYDLRIAFVRRVVAGHLAAVLALVAAHFLLGPIPLPAALALALGGLCLLSLVRLTSKGDRLDGWLSLALLVPTGAGLVGLAQALHAGGWPVVAVPLGSGLLGLYTALCGRDFSFSFVPVASIVVGGLALWGAAWLGWLPWVALGNAVGILAVWCVYLAYDLAMVVKRRRPDEPLAAVADLFRDSLNLTAYVGRVWIHWRQNQFI